ncbi:nucleoside deaminase [Halorubrum sp. CBA1125]|uniref:nucleoside deaminase n=1 Tax=Halorubrum sp. CBA1125 TaxID=2668072 RepID=UPI003743837B
MTDGGTGNPDGNDGTDSTDDTDDSDRSAGDDADDRAHVERAIELSAAAVAEGNTPFGALLVVDGAVRVEAKNETVTSDDVTAHPELTLARRAARELDPDERAACTMYASTEPCPMCATANHYAGIGRVVFGVAGETLDELAGDVVTIPCAEVIRRADGTTVVEGPVAEDAAMAVHESFYGSP